MTTEYSLYFRPPKGWVELEMEPVKRKKQLHEALGKMRGTVAHADLIIPRMEAEMGAMIDQAWNGGIRYAITTTPETYDNLNLNATFMIAFLPHAAAGGDEAADLNEIAQNMINEKAERDLKDGEVFELSQVEVPAMGKGVRVASILSEPAGDSGEVKIAMLRTFLPYPNGVLVATGITPQIEMAQEIFKFFDAMTATIAVKAETSNDDDTNERAEK